MSLPRPGRCLLAVALALGLLVLVPSPSWACSCASATVEQQVQNAETVASGTVDWTATDGQTRTYNVAFDAVYKGTAGGSEKLTTSASEASCGLTGLVSGRRYLFFIDGRHPGTMQVGLCGGTVAYDDAVAGQVESVTGPPGEPLSAPTVEQPAEDDGGTGLLLGLGATALLLLVAVTAVAVRRKAPGRGGPF